MIYIVQSEFFKFYSCSPPTPISLSLTHTYTNTWTHTMEQEEEDISKLLVGAGGGHLHTAPWSRRRRTSPHCTTAWSRSGSVSVWIRALLRDSTSVGVKVGPFGAVPPLVAINAPPTTGHCVAKKKKPFKIKCVNCNLNEIKYMNGEIASFWLCIRSRLGLVDATWLLSKLANAQVNEKTQYLDD